MATITPHIVIFKASDYNLVWLLKDVTFTATHTSDSVPSDCFQRQMHCDEIMYSADVCSFNGDICQSATLGIILCTLYFNVRLWKDSKPSADNNISNMMRAKKQVEGRTQLCNLCSLVSHTRRSQVEGHRQLCNLCSCLFHGCMWSHPSDTYICRVVGVSQLCDECRVIKHELWLLPTTKTAQRNQFD